MAVSPVRLVTVGEDALKPSILNRPIQDILTGSGYLSDGTDFSGFAKLSSTAAFSVQWGPSNTVGGFSGRNFAYNGGAAVVGGVYARVAGGTVLLTDNAISYVERNAAGVVTANTVGFTQSAIPMAKVTTLLGVITAVEDWRIDLGAMPFYPPVTGELGVVNPNYPVGNVRRYGAVGTGDETTKIMAAFAAVLLNGGGLVVFEPGKTYTVSSMLGCTALTWANRIDNCRVWAYGATITNTTTSITLGLLGSDVKVLGGNWIRQTAIDYDLSVAVPNTHTIYVGSDLVVSMASRVEVRDAHVQGSSLHGISASACDGIRFICNTVSDCLGSGIFGGNCKGSIIIDGNTVERTRDDNIHLDNIVGSTAVMDGQIIAGNHCRHTYATNIRASGVDNCIIKGNTADNSRASAISVLAGGKTDTIVGASNATPIVITTQAAHGRAVGDTIAIRGVMGNLAANGVWVISAITSTTYTLYNSAGSGAFAGSSTGLTAAVTAASNATPIAITTGAAHNLSTGAPVNIAGVLGNLAANGNWIITVVDATHFTLNTSVGSGAYTSGGVVTPYLPLASAQVNLAIGANNILRAGKNYGAGKYATTVNANDCNGISVGDATFASLAINDNPISIVEGNGIIVTGCMSLTICDNAITMSQGPSSGAAWVSGIQVGKLVDLTGRGVQDFTISGNVISAPSGDCITVSNCRNGSIQANTLRRWKSFGGGRPTYAVNAGQGASSNILVDQNLMNDEMATGTYLSLVGTNVVDGGANRSW